MLRFRELHSGPARLLSKQVGGAITQPPAYIPGQTGGKDPKPKKEPKVKVDKSINFSSFEWRQENFPVIADYGGEHDLEGVIKEKTQELLKYLKAQPEKLMKEQGVWDTVKDTITEIEEAFASNKYDEIELAYTNATDMLSEKDGGLDKTKFIDVKFAKEKTVRKKKAAEEDDDDIDVIEGPKRQRKPQLKGPERIKHHFKVLREERAQYKDRLINAKNWIKKREEELRTRKTWTGLAISDKEMISIPLKIEAKRKQYDAIKKDWIEKRQGVYERAKAKYEKLMGVKIDDSKPKKEVVKEAVKEVIKEIAVPPPQPPKKKKEPIKEEPIKEEQSEIDRCKERLYKYKEKLAKCREQLAMKEGEEDIDVIVPSKKSKPKQIKNVQPFYTYNVLQLKAKLKELKVVGYSKMRKPELLATLIKYYEDHPELEKKEPNSKPNLIATIKSSSKSDKGLIDFLK